jgi:DNA end-binding protein Ku
MSTSPRARTGKVTTVRATAATHHAAHPARKQSRGEGGGDGSGEKTSARALWSGSLGFGLVQIPVKLLTAEVSQEVPLHELDRHDGARIGYERINKTTGKRVEWGDIVKGYEIEKGRFVVLDPDDFRKANVEATQTIDILDFVRAGEIPLPFFERPYYVVPEKRGQKAYALLRDALAAKAYVGVALVVMRTRQHLCAIVPEGDGLVLELLRFAHELKPMGKAGVSSAASAASAASAKEVALAETLIEGMVGAWDPKKYRDSYTEDLLAAIRQKDKSGHIEPAGVPASREATVTDLAELLRRSLGAQKSAAAPKGARPAKSRKVA